MQPSYNNILVVMACWGTITYLVMAHKESVEAEDGGARNSETPSDVSMKLTKVLPVGMRIDVCRDMCRGVCGDMCRDVRRDMCRDMRRDMCRAVCRDMCRDMCTDMYTDMCGDM